MDPVLLIVIAIVLSLCILGYPYVKRKFLGKEAVENEAGQGEGAENNDNEGRVMAGGGRRAARQRRNLARQPQDNEVDDNEDIQQLPTGKIGTKKMRKLQAKAEKKALREQEEALRADEQKRKEQRDKERKEREEALITQQKTEEENALKLKKEKEERELEEYLALKESFVVEEEGETKTDEDRTLAEFIQYIKKHKVVFLEDLASEFNMRTQSVIDRIQSLQSNGQLSGVTDDRGKFIYISNEELRAVAKYIKQRGRVSISELAQSSNSFITL